MPQRTLEVEGPLDLSRTLRGLSQWGGNTQLRVEPGAGWYAERTPAGLATVHLRQEGSVVHAEAWGDGAALLLEKVPDLVGAHDDPRVLVAQHEVVAQAQKRARGVRLGRTRQIFPAVISAALAQKITGKEGKQSLKRIAWKWGDPAPGPRDDLVVFPPPRLIAETPYYAFHPLGIERHRADLIRRICSRAKRLQEAADMPYEDASRRLQALRGIGPWTAAVTLGMAMGAPDAVPTGDYHLPNGVSWALAGEPRGDDERMLELLEPYRGQRGRVIRLLKNAGALKAPKFGPRSDARDIRGI